MEKWRQLFVDIFVEGINSSSFAGAILQDTFQLTEAGLYWIFFLSRWTQLTTSNGQPKCRQQKQTEQSSLHFCNRGALLPQILCFSWATESVNKMYQFKGFQLKIFMSYRSIEPLPTVFEQLLFKVKTKKCPVFHHHALRTGQFPIGWRNILGASRDSYW